MTSEIRTNSLKSRAGLSTVTFTDSGPMFSGITTFVDNSGFNIGTGSSIFSPATNTLTLGTNSAERLRINSNGNVLIGSATPGYSTADDLTIATSGHTGITIRTGTTSQGNIYFADGTSGASQYAGLITYNHTSNFMFFGTNDGTERLRIDSDGRVQIASTNNSSTGTRLVVGSGNNMAATVLINTQDTNIKALQLSNWDGNTTTNKVMLGFDNSGHGAFDIGMDAQSNDFVFQSSSGERLRLTAAGLLGVNVSNPLQALHVAGSIINSTSVNSSGDQGIQMGNGHRLGFDQSGTRSWTLKAASSNLTFNSGDGNGAFDFNTTAHLKLPSGTTAQRVNTTGAIRYNNGIGNLEFYDGSNWKRIKVLEGPPTTGLLAYWPFSTASRSGSTYNDESGNNQHLTINGTVNNNTSESKFSGCIDFGTADGNHYLRSSSNSFTDIDASSGYSGVSVSVWVRTGNSTQNQWIISEGNVNTRWAFFNESANAPKWRSINGGDIIQSGTILDDVWHHLVVTFNSSNRLVQHYRDGSFINQGTTNITPVFNGEYLLVGQHSSLLGNASSYRWRGKMAHMRLYNRVLSAAEVENLYNQW